MQSRATDNAVQYPALFLSFQFCICFQSFVTAKDSFYVAKFFRAKFKYMKIHLDLLYFQKNTHF